MPKSIEEMTLAEAYAYLFATVENRVVNDYIDAEWPNLQDLEKLRSKLNG